MAIRDSDQPTEHLVEESPVLKESALHKVIMRNPKLVPAEDLGFGRVATAGTEVALSSGSADLVLIDHEGRVCIVEVKKEGNPDTRRVIAQLLDYAAALWGLTVEEFEQRTLRGQLDDPRSLHEFVTDELVSSDPENLAGESADRVIEALGETLRSGDFTLVLAAPAIPIGVQRVIEYLNAQGHSVFGLEISYFAGSVEAFVPRIVVRPNVGGRIAGRKTKPGRLDRDGLLLGIAENAPDAVKAAEAVLDWVEGEGRLRVHYTAAFARLETVATGQRFLRVSRMGNIRVEREKLRKHVEGWDDEQFVGDLARIGVNLDPASKQPKLPVEFLADATNAPKFFELMERKLDTLAGPK